jgi:alpha-1,2-mannosyltransferase
VPAELPAVTRNGASTDSPWQPSTVADRALIAAVIVLSFVARAIPLVRGGGLLGYMGYDDGVYYSSAVALVHGVLPYRDYLFLHPPGIAVLLSPFALLGALTADATGFAAARLAWMAIGALNAGLVALVAGRYGRRAGLLAGFLYAGWYAATRAERTTILIGPETTLLLIAVLLLGDVRRITRRRAAAAGAALGLSVAIQLWQIVPLVVVLGALVLALRRHGEDWRRPAVAFVAGAMVVPAIIVLPFFLAAPAETIRYVLVDQLQRANLQTPLASRLRALEGLPTGGAFLRHIPDRVVLAVAILGVVAVVVAAIRVPAARMWCLLVLIETTYLLVSPNFFAHYSGWIAPSVAIVVGVAAATAIDAARQRPRLVVALQLACVVILAFVALTTVVRRIGTALPRTAIERDVSAARCVAADAPVLLVETATLRRNLTNRCAIVLDPTGTSYDTDRGRLVPGPVGASRRVAPGYQAAMRAYYATADAALFTRLGPDGLSADTRRAIERRLPRTIRRGIVTVMVP